METPYKKYLHLNEHFEPEEYLVAIYSLETDSDFLETAGGIAAESSIGTWTAVGSESEEMFSRLSARVFFADEKSGLLKIAYPLTLFEPGNIPQLLSSIAGNIYGLKEVKNLKLLDLEMPGSYVRSFPGPCLGADGIYEIANNPERPLIGSILKPKEGLSAEEHANLTKEIMEAGVDLVKDDENLTSTVFNPFDERVKRIMAFKEKSKIYAFNITAPAQIMKERADLVANSGGNCLMIDIITAGFAAVQYIRSLNYGLMLHGHRAMHATITKSRSHGLSMMVLAKISRLAGIDSLHTGTVVGKMEGEQQEIKEINNFLLSDWYGLKPTLPVASGGLYPNLVPNLMRILGEKILLNFGGGIHGHPEGSAAGVRAVFQAVEAVKCNSSLCDYAQTHEELRLALHHWN